jgi:hypothetical protein
LAIQRVASGVADCDITFSEGIEKRIRTTNLATMPYLYFTADSSFSDTMDLSFVINLEQRSHAEKSEAAKGLDGVAFLFMKISIL